MRKLYVIQHLSCLWVDGKHMGITDGVTTLAIVRSHQHKFIRIIGACPIIASGLCVRPGSCLFLKSIFRIFVRHRKTHIISILCFIVPETSINISILISNRTIRLSSQIIRIYPQRFQRLCVKCLHFSA